MPKKRRARGRSRPPRLIECRFLVPLVRDSDRRPHPKRHWAALADALLRRFDGFTGPEGPVLGNYRNRSGTRVTDLSRRYTIALPLRDVDALRSLLRQVANTFDQECIYFVVGVEAELVGADPSAGDVGEV